MSRRLTVLAAALTTLAVLVSGCADDASDKAVEQAVEKAAASDGQDLDVDVDGNKVKIESSDGTVVAGSGELPEGYPADEVPVIDGDILVGVVVKGEGFQVTVASDLSAKAAFDEAVSVLEDAGVRQQRGSGLLGGQSAILSGNGYSVLLSANAAGGQTAVAYIVANK